MWLLGPALAATVTTYVVALTTRPPATCKLRVFLPEGRFAPGSELPVIVEVEAVSGPLLIASVSLRLVSSHTSQELVERYGSLVEPEEAVLQTADLPTPGRLEAGATHKYAGKLLLPEDLEATHGPAVEAKLVLEGRLPPVKARRLLKLS